MAHSVLHISTECYPAAKAGGMADVVGALPLYLPKEGWKASVIIPKYGIDWFADNVFNPVFKGKFKVREKKVHFTIGKLETNLLTYDFYCVDIPELYDRNSIYLNEYGHGFYDEAERNLSLQRSVLEWLRSSDKKFDLLHCHDHQTGFIPFMTKCTRAYHKLKRIPVFYTIHNGAYNSRLDRDKIEWFPSFPEKDKPLIEWNGQIDAICSALRFSDIVNTVSPTYLQEIRQDLKPLKLFFEESPSKFIGILNGIDTMIWDPRKDSYLAHTLTNTWEKFKRLNKDEIIADLYHLKGIPLISFIGRFAHQKGADLLVPSIERILARFGFVNFFILGSGDKFIEKSIQNLGSRFKERVAFYIGYDEKLAHKIYAASDFILMPSRFEPCGLNQLIAMRYGAIPVARETGGLKDTVLDYENGGTGISFQYDSVDDLVHAMSRALHLYKGEKKFKKIRIKASHLDYSWSNSAKLYAEKYNKLID